ncbi:MAG: nucleotidyltransferase family protein, partial [Hyphomicrobiales bacterium]
KLAVEHRAAPWVAAALATRPELANRAPLAPLVQAGSMQALGTLRLYAELDQLLQELNAAEVPVVVLKGPGVAQQFYPNRSLRPYGDLDLLINEQSLPTVTAMLERRGYAEKEGMGEAHRLHQCHGLFQRIFIHRAGDRVVEVHCDHLQIGLEPVGMDEIWERATPARFGRGEARVLEPHDLFVQLAVHLHRHGFNRLIWFKDLDLIVRGQDLDWQEVRERAARQGCLASVAQALRLLREMLGTPLPPGALALCDEQGWISRKLQDLAWNRDDILSLRPQSRWRLRRAVQFAPETGVLRGGLPSLLFVGRRRDKLRVLAAATRGHRH